MKFTFTFLPLLISCLVLTAQTVIDSTTAVVSTEAGKVRGRIINDVMVFKSIPYAAAPVGLLRFAAPAPHPHWDGVREFVDAAPTAPFNLPKPGDIDDYAGMGKGWVKVCRRTAWPGSRAPPNGRRELQRFRLAPGTYQGMGVRFHGALRDRGRCDRVRAAPAASARSRR